MGTIKDPNSKLPGEKKPGKLHYNPVNMAGKKAPASRDDKVAEDQPGRDEQRPKR